MKIKVIGILSFFIIFTATLLFVFKSQDNDTCQSNIKLVDESYYIEGRVTKNISRYKKKLSQLPDWLPSKAGEMYQNALSLAVNSDDQAVIELFHKDPTIIKFMGSKGFSLETNEEGYGYFFKVYKYLGCVSKISLTTLPENIPEGQKNDDDNFPLTIFTTKYLVPSGSKPLNEKVVNACHIRNKSQKILFTVDGVAPNQYGAPLEEYSVYLYKLFRSFNSKREKIYTAIGRPDKRSKNTMLWDLTDDKGQKYTVNIALYKNCESQLDIQWIGADGVNYMISKTSNY